MMRIDNWRRLTSAAIIMVLILFGLQHFAWCETEYSSEVESLRESPIVPLIPRPDPEGTSTIVHVRIVVVDVSTIHIAEQTFTADFVLILKWRDPRLALEDGHGSEGPRTVEFGDTWDPIVGIVNQRDLRKHSRDFLRVNPDGEVTYVQRFSGTLSARLDLRDFPLDVQTLPIVIRSWIYGPDEVIFDLDHRGTGEEGAFSIAGYTVHTSRVYETAMHVAALEREVTHIVYEFEAVRHTGFYFTSVLLPLTLIVLMAWAVFWIDPSAIDAQIGLPGSAILALVMQYSMLGRILPPVSYPTRLDDFVFGATVLVFASLGEAVITTRIARRGKEMLARRIDHWARWIYLIAAGATFVIALWL